MKHCSACGEILREEIPHGDDRLRKVCPSCATVHYENPRTVVGCLVERGEEVLLCRRAIEPAHGLWTVPAGFLEVGESTQEGARRETLEEACASVDILTPHSWLDLPHIGQSYSLFLARLRNGRFAPGAESLEARFFPPDEIPWSELAFPVVSVALRLRLEDRRLRRWHLHVGVLRWRGQGSRFDASSYDLQEHLRLPLEPAVEPS